MPYATYQAVALEGMATQDDRHTVTRTAQVDGILPGLFVVRGTGNTNVKAPVSAAEIQNLGEGFVQLDVARDPADCAAGNAYKAGQPLPVMRRGFIHVLCETAATRGNPVFVRFAGTGTLGAVRNDADTANAAKVFNARFEETITAPGLVLIHVDCLSPMLGA